MEYDGYCLRIRRVAEASQKLHKAYFPNDLYISQKIKMLKSIISNAQLALKFLEDKNDRTK